MRKLFTLFTILTLSITLAACGDNDEVTDLPQDDTTPNENAENDAATEESTDDENGSGDVAENDDVVPESHSGYLFTDFELEADIEAGDDAVDVDFEEDQDDTEVEASYENKQEDIDVRGNEAMEMLDDIFTGFQFDENTPDEEVLSEVMEAFQIPEDAAKVELDIEFTTGVEKEYNR